MIPDSIDFASDFHWIPGAIDVIQNCGGPLDWKSKTAAEDKTQELILQ